MFKSLIWKDKKSTHVIDPASFKVISDDLNLYKLYSIMSFEPGIKMNPEIFLGSLTSDAEDIIYRQCILSDFLKKAHIETDMKELISLLDEMAGLHKILPPDLLVPGLMLRLRKLELYCGIMRKLNKIFSVEDNSDVSVDFISISNEIHELNKKSGLMQIEKDIASIKEIIGKFKSIDLGVNIDLQFDAREAIITSVNEYLYEKSNIIDKLKCGDEQNRRRLSVAPMIDIRNAGQILVFSNEIYKEYESLMNRELHIVKELIDRHSDLITSKILDYRDEICLYYGGLRLHNYITSGGYADCFAGLSESLTDIRGLFSLNMAYEKAASSDETKFRVVRNNIKLDEKDKACIITGANDGGKTVLLESLATIQLLFQNGMTIPADKARLPVYKKIFTHFPKDEDINLGAGRLGEEAARISRILEGMSKGVLVILNEPYITTSPREGLEILGMTMARFRELGATVYLVTHYLDILSEMLDKKETISYVMETSDGIRTYRAIEREPMADSLALDVALSYGVDEKGIMKLISSEEATEGAM